MRIDKFLAITEDQDAVSSEERFHLIFEAGGELKVLKASLAVCKELFAWSEVVASAAEEVPA